MEPLSRAHRAEIVHLLDVNGSHSDDTNGILVQYAANPAGPNGLDDRRDFRQPRRGSYGSANDAATGGPSVTLRDERQDRLDDVAVAPQRRWPVPSGVRSVGRRVRRNLLFGCVLLAAAALRAVTVLAYPGVLWFSDSRSYLGVAVRPAPYPARPQGYAFFLRALEPAHSFIVVTVVQHLLVLAAAIALYALMRRRFAVRRWAATLATVPLLFDAYHLQIEHMLMSDVLFEVLVIAAVVAVLWKPRPGWVLCGVAGLAIGAATLTRSVGLPLIAVVAVVLLIRRVGVRALGAAALACAVPMAAYAVWFHAYWGVYGFTNGSGLFLYGRTATFAQCAEMKPPASERFLCPRQPVGERGTSAEYIWHGPPVEKIGTWHKFTPRMSALTGDFARRAIMAQPLGYLREVGRDLGRTFEWNREPYPTRANVRAYRFPTVIKPIEPLVSIPGATVVDDYRTYGHTEKMTRVVEPYAGFLRSYQDYARLPGTLFGLILAIGLAGMVPLWRRPRKTVARSAAVEGGGGRRVGAALLPWATALALVVVPPVTSAFGYRYVFPAVPLACAAAAIAVTEARNQRADRIPRETRR